MTVSANTPPSAITLLVPANGAQGVSPVNLTFSLKKSTDAEGNPIAYTLCLREENGNFVCTDIPTTTAMIKKGVLFAGMGMSGAGFLWFGAVLLGGLGNKKRNGGLMVLLFASALLLASCSSNGSGGGAEIPTLPNEIQHTVSTLKPDTTYFWKVIARDDKGATTESEVRSFTTQ